MLKYSDKYRVTKSKTENKDDNYIQCKAKKAQIYRFSDDKLAVTFFSNKFATNKVKELITLNINLKIIQNGDSEYTYIFDESDYEVVFSALNALKKRQISEEQMQKLIERGKELSSFRK